MKKKIINEIVYYYLGEIVIECIICDDNIKIKDSHLVIDDAQKLELIDDLLKSFTWFNEHRTRKDILNEWKVHNLFYKLNFKRERTKDTDIECRQRVFMKFAYWFFSKFAKNV